VRFHPVVGGPHDGNKYRVRKATFLRSFRTGVHTGFAYTLKGKPNYVPEEHLSLIEDEDMNECDKRVAARPPARATHNLVFERHLEQLGPCPFCKKGQTTFVTTFNATATMLCEALALRHICDNGETCIVLNGCDLPSLVKRWNKRR